ncbi:MAG: serine hydrolase [Actinomycetota bacterium]
MTRQPPGGLDAVVGDLFDRPPDEGTSLALMVLQGGDVIAERYGVQPANAFEDERVIDASSTLISWSMAKSMVHAATGILVADGLLDLDAPAPVPEWRGTDKADITTLDLLEMRSGLRFVEDYVDDEISDCIEMLFGDSGPSHAGYTAAKPRIHSPGTVWNYSSGETNVICRIIGDIVAGGVGGLAGDRQQQMLNFLDERLFGPIGMTSAAPKFDDAGDFVGSSYVYATARDFARFGELYRNDGVAPTGTRVLPAGWSDHARHKVADDPDTGLGYGRHWWVWPDWPGSLSCNGHEGQYIVVVPDRDVVVVHLGKTSAEVADGLRHRLRHIIELF